MKAKVKIGYHKRNIKSLFLEPVWSFYYGGTIRFIRKKVSVLMLQNRKEYERLQERGYEREEGKKAT